MSIEGCIYITLQREGQAIQSVQIQSSRPYGATRVFHQKKPSETMKLVGLMYNICGIAQLRAAQLAFSQALNHPLPEHVVQLKNRMVLIETAREHLCRMALDWPAFLNEEACKTKLTTLNTQLNKLKKKLQRYDMFGDAGKAGNVVDEIETNMNELITWLHVIMKTGIIGQALDRWVQLQDVNDLKRWINGTDTVASRLMQQIQANGWEAVGSNAVTSLPDLPASDLNVRFQQHDADQFIERPQWQDACFETTPLSRQRHVPLIIDCLKTWGNGLLSRIVARMHELVDVVDRLHTTATDGAISSLESDQNKLPAGVGIGQVEAARGRLVHRVVMENDRVKSYQILAPTEWNFHPEGVLAKALSTLKASDDKTLRQQAGLLINTIDPCVGYQLRLA